MMKNRISPALFFTPGLCKKSFTLGEAKNSNTGCLSPQPPVTSSSLRSLLLAKESAQRRVHAAQHLRVQQRAQKDHSCAHPMPGSEGVLEVEDGEDEAQELPQGHHQSHRQRGAFCGQNEHAAYAYISEKLS